MLDKPVTPGHRCVVAAGNGSDRADEVGISNGWPRTPFHVTRNELAVSEERHDEWCLLGLWDFAGGPKTFE